MKTIKSIGAGLLIISCLGILTGLVMNAKALKGSPESFDAAALILLSMGLLLVDLIFLFFAVAMQKAWSGENRNKEIKRDYIKEE